MWSTRAKRALPPGGAARALVPAASAAPKSGHGRSSAVTRSMSAAVFRPTSSRSTRRRTSRHEPEFAGLSRAPQRRRPSGSAPAIATAAGPARPHLIVRGPGVRGVPPKGAGGGGGGGGAGGGKRGGGGDESPPGRRASRGPRGVRGDQGGQAGHPRAS